uniref:3-hydroxyisobutyryl-CoA hydrolase n=1 Tax=Albugo laibachii Nc14 TaxID=890382 RepID=F0WD25_9STRA|nr:3hydroxyisobutyrylCoA hydrolase putative [Albugo laibachii Nc14]|eukprot:CCA19097.1 3hydroxyisobutyrylCoA hydrolase putative [Albugo laibachii Nc14]
MVHINQFSGWVHKQGAVIKTWKRRYMVLNGNVLKYYDSALSIKMEEKGSVQILSVEMSGSIQNGRIMHGKGGRVLKIYTDSSMQNKEWFEAITNVVCGIEKYPSIDEAQNINERPEVNVASDPVIRMSLDSTKAPSESTIQYSGWLVKQGGRVKNWKRRFFLLRGDNLSYFDTESTGAVAKGTLYVIASSQKVLQEWLHTLGDVAMTHIRDRESEREILHSDRNQHYRVSHVPIVNDERGALLSQSETVNPIMIRTRLFRCRDQQSAFWGLASVAFRDLRSFADSTRTVNVEPSISPDFHDIIYQQDSGLRIVKLNRPKALNALSFSMIDHMYERFKKFEKNWTINSVILSGMGDRAFCAGGDIRALYEQGKKEATRHLGKNFFRREYELNYFLATTEMPIISFLNGITMGGGVGISMHGKFVVATEKTIFAMPETAIGFFPDVGSSYLLPRLGRRLIEGEHYTADVGKTAAMEGQGLGTFLALTGERLEGPEVIGFGLATHYMESSVYKDLVHHLTGFDFPSDMPQEERDEALHEALEEFETEDAVQDIDSEYLQTVESIFGATNSDDTMEGIFYRLKNHNSDWSKTTLATLQKMSPLSLKVTLELMRQGAVKSCEDCFQMEYRVASRMLTKSDMMEGIRSMIIDKDRKPKWTHGSVDDVEREDVLVYFNALEGEEELVLGSTQDNE